MSHNINLSTVNSPCKRNCCLDNQDICMGCFRHLDEITGWQRFTEQEKIAILTLCTTRKQLAESSK